VDTLAFGAIGHIVGGKFDICINKLNNKTNAYEI